MITDNHKKLVLWIGGLLGHTYQWGVVDCASLAIRGVREICPDAFADLGEWNTKEEALREYARHGSLVEYLQKHGWREVGRNYVQSGDVVVVNTEPMQTASIAIDSKCPLIDPEKGVYMKSIFELPDWWAFRLVNDRRSDPCPQ